MDTFEEFLDLLLPSNCVICRSSGSNLCAQCYEKLNFQVRSISRIGLSGFAATTYTEQIAILIHEFKEKHQTALAKFFAKSMISAFENFDLQNCVLVAIPSKGASFAMRGFVPAKVLTNKLSREIAKKYKVLVPTFGGLGYKPKLSGSISDQAALSGKDRRTNLVGTMRVIGEPKFNRAILIDDIVTTGATMSEAKRALGEIGVEVLGFVAFAETLPKNMQKRHAKSV